MASSFEKPTAEQVRANYREQFFVADLIVPTVVDVMSGDLDGLIHKDKLGAPLKVSIPLWSERPPVSGLVNVLTLECQLSSSPEWVRVGTPEDVPGPDDLPDSAFPLPREIPLDIFKDYEGKFQFRYRVKNWNDLNDRESPSAPVTVDRTGPLWADPPHAVIDIVEKPVITDAVLTRDNGVFCVIPDFIETKRAEVQVHVAWLDRVPLPTDDITDFIVLSQAMPADRKVLVPAAAVRAYGSKTQYAVAILVDKAGNRGELSLPATVQVALGTLPSALKPCTVPLAVDGVIDRADAAFPTKVHIESYTGYNNDDGILVKWGTRELARTSVGVHLPFPLTITVPWSHMAQEYDFNSATHVQPVNVDYKILRGDYPYASPGAIAVNTDFAIPGPVNPDPDPINPNLNLIAFLSSSGSSTELTVGDIGKDATASIELFDDPEVGDTLTLFYNGVAVTSSENPYVVDGTEGPNEDIEFVIPWGDIEPIPVMNDLPLHYTLTRAGFANPQESKRTTIDVLVEIVDLPEPEFPDAVFPFGVANCNSLRLKAPGSTEYGIFVHIPASTYLKAGVDVELEWQTYEYDGTTVIADTDHEETVTVSDQQQANGIDWYVPYEKCLKPTFRPPISGGKGTVKYSIDVRGTPVSSDPVSVIVAVFESAGGPGNDHCKIPRP
ncbi:hypothetical protein [Pseudomonas grandcourensis]|uniref:hypothetical protein n=1 Tax=Pseudomonas grandcourensis TaxID=3136736 RepID=UPI003265B909